MVVKRPTGHKIIDQNIPASIIEDYVGDAIVQFPYHGLGTGDTVYIESDIDEYNGFWYVTAIDANQFKISEHSEADFVEYYQDADIDYYQTQEHDWSSIFLPIVYKITNTLWPVNTADAVRTVSSSYEDNGFTGLVLSGALKATFNALEFVKVGAEVYQIVEVISTSEIVINLSYDASNAFTTAQYYYNNYQVRVKIYAGLPASHPWEPKKPFEEVAELSLTPDENNEVMFSVSDYITQKVAIKNNTLLYSLPLNLDAFTAFFISTGESFDQSDNYSLYTSESNFENDDFEGYAIAGKLPFKNMYSGDYANYVYTSGSPALWLTILDRLLAVDGLYFDVSFIKNIQGPFHITVNKYFTSDYFVTEILEFEDFGIGVYRIPLVISSTYESYCITAAIEEHEEEVPPEEVNLSEMFNSSAGGTIWTLGEFPSVVLPGAVSSKLLVLPKSVLNGQTLKVNYNLTMDAGVSPSVGVYFGISSDFISLPDQQSVVLSVNGVYSGSVNVLATADRAYFAILASNGGTTPTITINSISFGDPSTITVPGATITEEICIDIIDSCEAVEQFVADNIRLLEDGDFRLLE